MIVLIRGRQVQREENLKIVDISPWNKGFTISLFVPIIKVDKSDLLRIAAPKILFPIFVDL